MSRDRFGKDDAGERCGPDALAHAVDDFQQGGRQEEGFRLLFDCFYEPVRNYFLRRGVQPPEESIDLTQKTFLEVYRGLGGLRDRNRVRAYLFTVARHNFIGWLESTRSLREAGPQVSLEEFGDQDPVVSDEYWPMGHSRSLPPDEELRRKERDRRLHEAVAKLPEKMRRCVELRLQGLRNREIAVVLRIAPGTVGAHLAQACEKLRPEFQ